MQKNFFILSFFLMGVFSGQSQSLGNCSFVSFSQDGCCVRFEVNVTSYADYQIEMGDGTILYDTDSVDDTFEYCYSTPGNYTVRLLYFDQNGDPACGAAINITLTPQQIEDCKPTSPCTSYLCWEDFIGFFDCATSITVELPNGAIQTIPFVNITNADDSWCNYGTTFPIPASVPVVGGYCEIGIQIVNAIQNLGFDVEINETGPQEDCFKGGSPIPGFFINSDVKVLFVDGDDCYGNSSSTPPTPFNHDNCN